MVQETYNKITSVLGRDWVLMDIDAVILCLQETVDIHPDIIGAIQSLYSCTSPWEDPFVFENTVDALNGNKVIPETITKPPLEDVLFTVHEMTYLYDKQGFSEDIAKYIASIAMEEGVVYLPEPCSFANEYLPPDDMGLQEIIKDLFSNDNIMRISLEKIAQEESPLSVQLAKILALTQKLEVKIEKQSLTSNS